MSVQTVHHGVNARLHAHGARDYVAYRLRHVIYQDCARPLGGNAAGIVSDRAVSAHVIRVYSRHHLLLNESVSFSTDKRCI